MCITAHPDDESLGFGGTLARYAAEGVEISLVVATRGSAGASETARSRTPGRRSSGVFGRVS